MKRSNPTNLNTAGYWNNRYRDEGARREYADETGTTRFHEAMEFIREGDQVLDLGCGIGTFCELVKDTKPSCVVVGADISPVAVDTNQARRQDIAYVVNHIGRERLGGHDQFDVVFSGETLEHLDEPQDLFLDAAAYLKEGGWLIVTTPNGRAIPSIEHTWIFTKDDIERLYTDTGFATPQFIELPNGEHRSIIMAAGRKEEDAG